MQLDDSSAKLRLRTAPGACRPFGVRGNSRNLSGIFEGLDSHARLGGKIFETNDSGIGVWDLRLGFRLDTAPMILGHKEEYVQYSYD